MTPKFLNSIFKSVTNKIGLQTDAHKIWTLVCIDKLYEEDTFTSAGKSTKNSCSIVIAMLTPFVTV